MFHETLSVRFTKSPQSLLPTSFEVFLALTKYCPLGARPQLLRHPQLFSEQPGVHKFVIWQPPRQFSSVLVGRFAVVNACYMQRANAIKGGILNKTCTKLGKG